MAKVQGKDEIQQTLDAIEEVRRFRSLPKFNDAFADLAPGIETAKYNNGIILNAPLRKLLSDYQVPSAFLSAETSDGIRIVLVEFLMVDHYYRRDSPDVSTIDSVWRYFSDNEELRKTFIHRLDRSLLVVYLDRFGYKSWNELALTLDGNWRSIALLNDSLPYCQVSLDAMFHFITVSCDKNPNDLGIGLLGNHILLKFQMEAALSDELQKRLDEVLEAPALRGMLPMFLRAQVGENEETYARLVTELPTRYGLDFPGELYYALGAACPRDLESLASFKRAIDAALQDGSLSPMFYLRAAGVKKIRTSDVIALAVDISSGSANKEELTEVLQFLVIYIDDYTEPWFKDIAARLVVRFEDQHHQLLEHFFYLLQDKDLRLIYELFSARFTALGEKGILKRAWDNLVEKDPELFAEHLTRWFKDGTTNTHFALLHLCSVEIPVSYFRVSSKVLEGVSASERLYIAYKIAGYVYSGDHLQQLLFSIVETVQSDQKALLQHLYSLFDSYVIYNYRGTLDKIDQMLKVSRLPIHLQSFYCQLREDYDQYFADLASIPALKELRPHSRLTEYIRFYSQEKFSLTLKDKEKSGLRSLFKGSPVHSHRWAIWRPEQKVHEVYPLAHIQSSFEFPSGEKLNPAYQELTRRTYQKIRKDEIDIDGIY